MNACAEIDGWPIATSAFGLGLGCLQVHGRRRALIPFLAGAALLAFNAVTGNEGPLALLATVCGAAMVMAAHASNLRMCRQRGARCAAPVPVREDLGYDRA
ncbi:MAG TPA: hypothetical protein VGQ37_20180 [Vicinamibacterales bacterium]|jgi:hypothetical protein|nr:hypothetical protein [Vicinamibacterales bacterium]